MTPIQLNPSTNRRAQRETPKRKPSGPILKKSVAEASAATNVRLGAADTDAPLLTDGGVRESSGNGQGIKADILEIIKERQPGTSFAELDRLLEGRGYDVEGEHWFGHPEHGNVFLWFSMSEPYLDALLELMDEGVIYGESTSPLVYIFDGKKPNFDIAKRPPKDGYVEPRWAPYTLYTANSPQEGADAR